MTNISTIKKNECCGCLACVSICPTNAIYIAEDKEGFRIPKIDIAQCINCGKCVSNCSFHNKLNDIANEVLYKQRCFAVRSKNSDVLRFSQSGGLFTAISNYILNYNGVIYGAIITSDNTTIHSRAGNEIQRNKMRGSKYVQSDLSAIWSEIKKDLEQGKLVLFTGTPCQCDAVKRKFSKYEQQLVVCDIVCHGVPSPTILREYLNCQEKKKKGRIEEIIFRDIAKFGWRDNRETLIINGKEYSGRGYASLFYSDYCLRQSCYNCPYSSLRRVGDITMGDFWGIEKISKAKTMLSNNGGISMALVNTSKGAEIFAHIIKSEEYEVIDCSDENYCLQLNLSSPTKYPLKREEFWQSYEKNGIEYVMNKYGIFSWKNRIKNMIGLFISKAKKE